MQAHTLQHSTKIARPVQEVFQFFSQAENLNKLTPPALGFTILTPLPISMQQGTLIDYRIRLHGIPFFWQTEISVWEPPYRFADVQVKGPYVRWEHEHRFKDLGNGTTEMTDTVLYRSPGWILEPLIHHLFVKKKVEGIFKYREEQLKLIFG